jgi:CubicO group peptidase (beta-lactamase class C family)
VPELQGTAYGNARIIDVLQMSSGVDFAEVYADKFSDINKLFYKTFIFGQSINDAVAERAFDREPGTKFHYISSDTQVLTWVLSKAVGKSLVEFAQEQLWEPLGMESDAWWNTDFHAAELGYCCLNAVLRDYGRFGQLYLQKGAWKGRQLLPADWVVNATRPSKPHLEPGANGTGDPLRGYQYQFWVPLNYDKEYFAAGIWGQYIWVSEKDNVVIVRTSVDPIWSQHLAETIAVNREIAKSVSASE